MKVERIQERLGLSVGGQRGIGESDHEGRKISIKERGFGLWSKEKSWG